MPFDGNGNWTSNFNAEADRDAGYKILASRFDNILLADIAQSFENCLTKDTQIKPQTNFNANNYRIINLANPEDDNDALTYGKFRTGNNTLTGNNTFSGNIVSTADFLKKLDATLGTVPSTNKSTGMGFYDVNNTNIGAYGFYYNSDGSIGSNFSVIKQDGSSFASFNIGFDGSQNEYASATPGVRQAISGWGMPDYTTGVSYSVTSGVSKQFTAPYNCFIRLTALGVNTSSQIADGSSESIGLSAVAGTASNVTTVAFVKKGDSVTLTAIGENGVSCVYYKLYG